MFSKEIRTVAVALVFATCLASKQASAGLAIYAEEAGVNGGAITQIGVTGGDFTSTSFTGDYGDFTITITGAASHNTAAESSLLTSTTSLMNNASTAKSISLFASQDNYTLPLGSILAVESGMSGTVNTGTLTGTGSFEAFLDKNNNLLGMSDFNNGIQNSTFTGSTFDTGSAFGTFNRANPDYSITSVINAVNVSAGGEGTFSSHVNVTATPEPSTLVSAGIGVVALGFYAWRRHRRAKMPA